MTFSPAVRRRDLAVALRRYRERARLDSTKVAAALGWDHDKVSRFETGRFKRVDLRDVDALSGAYGLDPAEHEELMVIAQECKAKGLRERYRGVFPSEYVEFEASATSISTYQTLAVHGLFQIEDYAAAIVRGGDVLEEHEVARRVAARMDRQGILERNPPPQIRFCVDEAALLKPVGGAEVMREQIRQLIHVASWPNVQIQVIPNEVGAHPSMSVAFTHLCFDDHPPLVYVELPGTPLLMDKHEETSLYADQYARVISSALSAGESLERMARLVND